jgi:hypothetical protein
MRILKRIGGLTRLDDGIEGDSSLAGGHDENGALGTGRDKRTR